MKHLMIILTLLSMIACGGSDGEETQVLMPAPPREPNDYYDGVLVSSGGDLAGQGNTVVEHDAYRDLAVFQTDIVWITVNEYRLMNWNGRIFRVTFAPPYTSLTLVQENDPSTFASWTTTFISSNG